MDEGARSTFNNRFITRTKLQRNGPDFIFLDRICPASLNKPFGQEALDRPSYAEARRIDGPG